MLEEELEEALEIYDEISAEISYRPICLVEGNNKFFYQLKNYTLMMYKMEEIALIL